VIPNKMAGRKKISCCLQVDGDELTELADQQNRPDFPK